MIFLLPLAFILLRSYTILDVFYPDYTFVDIIYQGYYVSSFHTISEKGPGGITISRGRRALVYSGMEGWHEHEIKRRR
jgi:hypothetical protein